MYKLMIVDDEPLVIKAITHIVNNNFNEITISGTTGNGMESIKLAREDKPDIILMDIKLNGLNGLESIKEISRFLPETVIVIISAYDDFNFAQRAIKLGVMDYLLKPINKTDIINILKKSLNYLNEIRMETQEKILLKEKAQGGNLTYPFQPPWELEKKLFKAIEIGDKEQVILELENLFNYFNKEVSLIDIINYFRELTGVIFRMVYEYIPKERYIEINLNKLQARLNSTLSRYSLYNTLKDVMLTIMKIVNPSIKINSNPLLKEVKDYIDKNYFNDISLDDIARHVAMSPGYLSKLFKENFDITIIDYLTRVRINNSIKLLKNPELHIKEIARKVGYHDSNYFSKVFKKITGKTPTEYRE